MNKRQEGHSQFVVARGNTPEMLDACEEAFDQIAIRQRWRSNLR